MSEKILPKKAIIAKKIGSTSLFVEDGRQIPVTVLQAGPCVVAQKKTVEKDGYAALQVGFGEKKLARATKPEKGHITTRLGANAKIPAHLKELRLADCDAFEIGQEITVAQFSPGDFVDISGKSKGKGYQGAIKRHGQSRGPSTHGSKYHRGLGSMGPGTTPGSVKKGKKTAGHMGAVKVTTQRLEVIKVDVEKNLLLIKGSAPGPRGAILFVKNSVKA